METTIKLFLASWLWTYHDYIQYFVLRLPTFISDLLSCFKCVSFWVVLIGTFDIWNAITCAIIATIYDRFINA